ncbi:non-homologous end-joining DNA ligase [Lihuaxuella thermophila]|uniref:Bifunctional non-homologous end joining protein LigD n=1 Tax=Lihuaxuella thermophila TaxID=1173111 RepID=A0A1H8FCI7_9BACL|nr:non-homologous end-joining DNA ligase [Lihuaxuella thermophila]SEN29601.1 bifunctional non-homologous end joining protein LigD [Lihuaxuella thermophila]
MGDSYRLVRIEDAEIKISNPHKLLFPKAGITKWDFILACTRLAPLLLPYCKNRLLTTIRYPDGAGQPSFYQKNAPHHRPDWVQTEREGEIEYILLNNTPTLIWLANLACLEFHVSFHTANHPDYPTELVMDLDPSVDDFSRVVEVALLTRQVLHQMNLDGVIKTSGASGLQIYVPIEPRYRYEQTRKVNHFIARYLAERHPSLITLERKVHHRGDKVYFDYLQHWRNKTLVAPYSPRATPEATVSTPVGWEEVNESLSPKQWTLETIFDRLKQRGDLFEPVTRGPGYRLDPILQFMDRHRL